MKKILKIIAATLTICWVISEVASVIEYIIGKRGWTKHHKPYGIYERLIKRPLDNFISAIALLILWPLMVVIALLVKIKLGSPVLFTQERPGLDEKTFKLYKFRTMTDECDEVGELMPDEVRLTKFGAWLRSTSLDELPELINILKGDMSLVGPRPQLVRDMVFMSEAQRQRHAVRPGLTGLAQVMGRNSISWEEKLEWDLKYINKICFVNDLKIVMKTVSNLFSVHDGDEDDTEITDDYGDALLKVGKISREEYEKRQIIAENILSGRDKC